MQSILRLVIIGIVLTSCRSAYNTYVPIYFTGEELVERPDSLTERHVDGIKKVFKHFDVPYKAEQGKVYYKGKIDKELLWNYTKKASDERWLKNHH